MVTFITILQNIFNIIIIVLFIIVYRAYVNIKDILKIIKNKIWDVIHGLINH
jgi:hypothetical protein